MSASCRRSLLWFGLLALLPLSTPPVQAADAGFPAPAAFDAKAAVPDNLPPRLEIPPFTRLNVRAYRKVALPPAYAASPRHLLWSPDLVQATFESDAKNVQAVYHWEGGATTHGYEIDGVSFFSPSLKYPDAVSVADGGLGLAMNLHNTAVRGRGRDFPEVTWYDPDHYAGAAQLDGKQVWVFAWGFSRTQGGAISLPIQGDALYLDAKTLLPVLLEAGDFAYAFDYAAAPGVKIDPQGAYLKTMQANGASPL